MSDNSLAQLKDVRDNLLYKLRLNKLDKKSRTLQKNNIIDSNGFLTITGSQVFLDALWQTHPEIQKSIADELETIKKVEKDESK